ncbi:MAG TPA: RNA-binding S4 domain-containing protein [Solirubrobacteraceae bacterium]|nr:RNA-binding S4 domain-containing protein [Solirubrobacteraceae bacterium]
MHELTIRGDTIRLGQLLKLSGLAGSGAEAKALLADQQVQVNGEPEVRRGRQLHDGDVVALDGVQLRVSAAPGPGS